MSPYLFLCVRFGLACLFFIPILIIKRVRLTKRLLKHGASIGFFMYLGMILQTLGLQFTSASRSGFITGLCVVLVPIFVVIIERRFPNKSVLAGVLFAAFGLYLLSNPQGGDWNKGDTLTLLSAVAFAFQIIFIGLWAHKSDPFGIAFVMLAVTSLLSLISGALIENMSMKFNFQILAILFYMAFICTTIAFAIQVRWQPKTSPTAAAVIYTTEPVFAVVFAMLVLHEKLTINSWTGAAFILLGMLVTEIRKEQAVSDYSHIDIEEGLGKEILEP